MMLCRELEILPIEVVVRGYLSGSGWKAYQKTGEVCGVHLPSGLRESDRLPEPILTPSTKARAGRPRREHHVRGDDRHARRRPRGPGPGRPDPRAGDPPVRLRRGGRGAGGHPRSPTRSSSSGSSRGRRSSSWPTRSSPRTRRGSGTPRPGSPAGAQASFDKQFVRDWLETQPWDKTAPGPELPADVVAGTRERYVAAFERITGASFARYLEEDVIAR